jgi:CYTH domain-containing protein
MIENERKYVLSDNDPKRLFNQLLNYPGATYSDIDQGYLPENGCRIRRSVDRSITGHTKCEFTYKKRINGQQVEIETIISYDDFSRLWTQVGKIITKWRVVIPTYADTWEVDFFRAANTDKPYLVMAEVELPEGKVGPDSLPDFISNNLLHAVEYGDKRFDSKELSKPLLVAGLIEKIKNGSL